MPTRSGDAADTDAQRWQTLARRGDAADTGGVQLPARTSPSSSTMSTDGLAGGAAGTTGAGGSTDEDAPDIVGRALG